MSGSHKKSYADWYSRVGGGTLRKSQVFTPPATQIMESRGRKLVLNKTDAESLLRDFIGSYVGDFRFRALFNRPFSFYIPDFYFPVPKLIVECDGSQHRTPEGLIYDSRRDSFFRTQHNIETMRFSNEEILEDVEIVMEKIVSRVESRIEQLKARRAS